MAFVKNFASRVVQAVEHGIGIPVFPSWKTIWHFDDKIAQTYLLQAAGLPTPQTWIFWDRDEAMRFARTASYPLVIKLASGITSENVALLQSYSDAWYWIDRMFGSGLLALQWPTIRPRGAVVRRASDAVRLLTKGIPPALGNRTDLQKGYVLLQEFLPGNQFDTRVTVIGNRAFAFQRLNRPDDFRASGSGRIEFDPSMIDLGNVRLAFQAARQLQTQSLATDVLYRNGERVLVEISYYYEGWAVQACPGHWELRGEPKDGQLDWIEGEMRPEDAILADFLAVLDHRERSGAPNGGARE